MKYSSPKFIFLVASGAYLSYGIFNAGIGPLLGELAAQTGSSLAAVGVIFSALSAGSLLAQLVSGSLTDRYGRKPVFAISTGLFAVSILGILAAHSLVALLALAFLAGLGQGGIDLGSNLFVAEAYPEKRVAALNLVHLFFGIGSSAGPAFVSLSLIIFQHGLPALGLAVVLFIAVLVMTLNLRVATHPGEASTSISLEKETPAKQVYAVPKLWLLGGLLLLIVGAEVGVGSWATTYLTRTTALSLETAALATAGYWACITLGRLVTAVLTRYLTTSQILLGNVIGSLISAIGLVLAHQAAGLSILFILAMGLFLGSLYPLVVAVTTISFPAHTGKASSVVVALGTVGGLIVPALAGLILQSAGPQEYTWLLAGILAATLVVEQAAMRSPGQASAQGLSELV